MKGRSRHFFALCFSVVFFAISLTLTGCGYTFQGGGSVLPPDVKKIYIPLVENDSTEGGIANVFTEALRDQFERYGVVEVSDNALGADAVLKAHIKDVKRETRSVSSKTDIALQYDIIMSLSASLERMNGTVLWRNDAMVVSNAAGAAQGGIIASSADFAQGIVGASDLDNLDPRQVARSQEQAALEQITVLASQTIYQASVAPEF